MSKEHLEQKKAAAESRWEAIQLQAAMAQREIDFAVAYYSEHKDELDPTVYNTEEIDAQIERQKESIKDFLLKGHQAYKEAILSYDMGLKRLNA